MNRHSRPVLGASERRRSVRQSARRTFRPLAEAMERRSLMAFSGGTGAVVIGLAIPLGQGRTSIVVSFDGPLVATTAEDVGYYQVNAVGPGNPEVVTSTGAADPVVSASYNAGTQQVTLGLAKPLALGQFYRVMITSQPSTGVMDVVSPTPTNGITATTIQPIDGDNDDTPAGDFYGLVGLGTSFRFTDDDGDTASIQLSKGGSLQVWRELNGDVDQLGVVGAVANRSVLTGSVRRAKGSDGQVVLPSTIGLGDVIDKLSPSSFPIQGSTTSSPAPVVATTKNLPYSLEIQAVSMPTVPSIQSAVSAQSDGLWLVFGGRTNGLHNFDPTGVESFPPQYQNNNIYVIDPATGQTWTEAWTSTGLPQSVWAPLASSNQESYQLGDRLYAIGGYSSITTGPDSDPTINFYTYSTLSSISVSGLINAVMTQGSAVSSIEQISDPRFTVTGGDLGMIGNRSYLVFGQDFQGGYNGDSSNGSQVYTDEIQSFQIIDNGQGGLSIANYQVQRDPVNFRRRDGNLVPVVFPNGKPGLEYLGGVFTVPAGGGYVNPVIIANNGTATVNSYQQYFSQYTSAKVGLFDSRTKSLDTILFGGISLYDYNFATGSLTSDTMLPFVDDVTTLQQRANGTSQEFIMPSQFPGLYGAGASYLAAPGLPTTSNGVIELRDLKGPTTLGYIYGGIVSTTPNTTDQETQTTASDQVFKLVLVPN
jgi:hypothetical protein